MLKEFFFLEIKSALKAPMVYIFTFLIALMSFMAVVSDNVVIGGAIGNIYKNAPHVITQFVSTFSLIGILFAVAFFNNAALRDHNNQFHEILYTTPIKRHSLFFGRFFGALLLATIPLLGIFLGVVLGAIIGPLAGWIDADRIGPFYAQTFINNYLLYILPNMFFGGVIVYSLATKFKSTVVSFVGALGLIIAYAVSGTLLSDIDNETLGGLLDSFGLSAYEVYSRYFTPIEKNTLSPSFSGILLWNRLLWIGVGLIVLLISYATFSFQIKSQKKKKAIKAETHPSDADMPISDDSAMAVQGTFGSGLAWTQFKSFFKISFLNIVKSMVFRVIFLFAFILLVVEMVGGYEYYGLQSYPFTYIVVDMITGSSNLFLLIILVFFSGELVWRDRLSKIHEVVNASPHPSLAYLLAKVATLLGVISLIYFFFSLIGILYQLILGFTRIEPLLYLSTYVVDLLPGFIFYSIFFIFIQVVVNQRYQGYFFSILLVFIWDILLLVLDVQSNMVDLGGGPSTRYSDMNGFGPGLLGSVWFNIYWLLFAFIILIITALFWVRSSGGSFKSRLKVASLNFNKPMKFAFFTILALWVATASFVYYNTFILNPFKSSDELEAISVSYEKKYKKYQHRPLPKITEVTYHVDIFPEERDVIARAEMRLINDQGVPIDSIHYNLDQAWDIEIDIPKASLVLDDDTLGYRIYELAEPLDSGEFIDIEISSKYQRSGFENGRGNTSIVRNGTFLNSGAIMPTLGYYSNAELSDKNDRKKYGLPPRERTPQLDSSNMELRGVNYLSEGRSDWVNIETYISTSDGQMAVAPGELLKTWQEDGRNHYQYKISQPSQLFCSFVSADYEVATREWRGISLEVYYDRKHDDNVEMMLDAIQASLEYYTKNFGPYTHQQARIIEFPRYATFAQAFPGTMPYSEAFGFIIDLEDTTKNNVINAVIAHEMAHQWWAHQEIGASMQGGTMLTESFSEYSSLMVMKQKKDDFQMKEFLKYDFNRYLRGRATEREKELPLYQVENQSYIHYGKGSVILYGLQAYIGEEKVNRALRNFLEEYRYQPPPYPTSLDFIKHLEKEVPDSLDYLIEDWFKKITLYDFRLEEATYEKLAEDRYQVELKLINRKMYADTLGNETETKLADWVDIGLFSDAEAENPILIQRVMLKSGSQNLRFEVDQLPAKAAIDPKRLLIERVYDDNYKSIKEG